MCKHDSPCQPRLPPLSDEAVVEILDFLHEILTVFESRYGGQIHHYYEERSRHNLIEPDQHRDRYAAIVRGQRMLEVVQIAVRETKAQSYRFSVLVQSIVNSVPFQMRLKPSDQDAPAQIAAAR